jgi:uncharacterized protein YbaR (Trm112 family)
MKKTFVSKLCCPFDKSDLQLKIVSEQDNEIREGLLTCSECSRYFPIVYGIPIMSPDEYRERSLEDPLLQKWGVTESRSSAGFLFEAEGTLN